MSPSASYIQAMVAALASALALTGGTLAGGYPVTESGPSGIHLRYIAGQPFGIGIFLKNRSREPLVVEDVRVAEPPLTLVHQIGTRLHPWTPPVCSGNHSCPFRSPPFGPFGAAAPRPVRVEPGGQVAVELDYRLGACSEVPFAAPVSPRTIDVRYRVGPRQLHAVLPLGGARPVLRMPTPADCVPRPHSDIAITGPWSTGSTWTMPGSAGDTCRGGVFTSRTYVKDQGPMVYVRITPATKEVEVVVGIGLHGWTTFHSRYAVVTTLRTQPNDYGGRFHATIVGRRGSTFRAFGAWRCQLRR
jgi:hypothetical protein